MRGHSRVKQSRHHHWPLPAVKWQTFASYIYMILNAWDRVRRVSFVLNGPMDDLVIFSEQYSLVRGQVIEQSGATTSFRAFGQ